MTGHDGSGGPVGPMVHRGEAVGQLAAEMLAIHAVLRRACDILVTAAQRCDADATMPAELDRFGSWAAQAITHHHDGEETLFWPELCATSPTARGILGELTEQHAHLHIAVGELGAALDRTRSERSPDTGARLVTAAVRLRDALGAHLQAEEHDLPGLLGHVGAARAAELSRPVSRTAPRHGVSNFIGLVVDTSRPVIDRSSSPICRFAHLPLRPSAASPIRWARRPLYRRYRRTLAGLYAGGPRLTGVMTAIGFGEHGVDKGTRRPPGGHPLLVGVQAPQVLQHDHRLPTDHRGQRGDEPLELLVAEPTAERCHCLFDPFDPPVPSHRPCSAVLPQGRRSA